MKFGFVTALLVGKLSCFIAQNILKKETTTRPGIYALRVKKDFIKFFKNIDYDKTIFITGTNGKSTTNNLITHVLRENKSSVTTNLEGANMLNGIATALIKNSTIFGKIKSDYLVFEVDERFLAIIHNYIPAKIVCFTNLQKDQVQRNGDPSYIYKKMKDFILDHKEVKFLLNNDDPRSNSLGKYTKNKVFYGVNKNHMSFEKNSFFDVTMPCPICNETVFFNYYNIDNIGSFKCLNCDLHSQKKIDYCVSNVDFDKLSITCNGKNYHINNAIPFFLYNYALTIALSKYLKISDSAIDKAFKNFKNVGDRIETLNINNKEIKYIRIKQENSETLQHAIDYVGKDTKDKIVLIGLEVIKDFKPYYSNTFYAFDCNYDVLKDKSIKKIICFSEAVSYDIANCLIYFGIDPNKIVVIPNDNDDEILKELDKYNIKNIYLITWIKKYQELKKYCKGDK